MARPRRTSDLGQAFTFGGRIPASIGILLVIMLFATVTSWMNPAVRGFAALAPAALVEGGEVWRLVTWAFVQGDPLGLLFVGFMLWSIGQQLSYAWSERRFFWTFIGLAVGASIVTTLLALVWAPAGRPHIGAWPVANALLVMWAMMFPDRQVNIWGVLPMTGKTLAMLIVFATVLYGLAGGGIEGIGAFTPHFAAMGLGYLHLRGVGRGAGLGGLRQRLAQASARRRQRARSKHLKVIGKDGEDERPRWMN